MTFAWPRCRGSSSPRRERSTANTGPPPSSALPHAAPAATPAQPALDPHLHPATNPRSLLRNFGVPVLGDPYIRTVRSRVYERVHGFPTPAAQGPDRGRLRRPLLRARDLLRHRGQRAARPRPGTL